MASVSTVKSQCPAGARAFHILYIFQTDVPPPLHTDTLCWVDVHHFPVNSKVYIYNLTLTLVDSVTTDAVGYGLISLSTANCFFSPGPNLGTAVCGSCTTNISGAALLPIKIRSFVISTFNNKVTAQWQLEEEYPGIKYSLQESNNGRDFNTIYTVSNNTSAVPGGQYKYEVPQLISSKRFYRVIVTEQGGAVDYSDVKSVLPKAFAVMDIYPAIGNGNLSINVPVNFINGEIKVFNSTGSIIHTKKITASFFKIILSSGKGLFYVKAAAPDGALLVKTILVQ